MRPRQLLIALILFGLSCRAAQACVCEEPVDHAQVSKWIEERVAAASYVVFARITEVKRSGRIPALDTIVIFETREQLKGVPRFSSVTISECQNFELRENDTRVLFLSADRMICPCTEYRQFVSDAELLGKLREQAAAPMGI